MDKLILDEGAVSIDSLAGVAANRRVVILDESVAKTVRRADLVVCSPRRLPAHPPTLTRTQIAASVGPVGDGGEVPLAVAPPAVPTRLTPLTSRAAAAGVLVQLFHSAAAVAGKPSTVPVRLPLLTTLADALNAGGLDALDGDDIAGSLAAALSAAGFTPNGVEVGIIRRGITASWAAIAAVHAHIALGLATVADAVAAGECRMRTLPPPPPPPPAVVSMYPHGARVHGLRSDGGGGGRQRGGVRSRLD